MTRKAIEGKVECGDTARCKVTLIEGVVVVRHDYLYGIPRIGIRPPGSFEGKKHETIHMNIPQAELLEKCTVSREGMEASKSINLGDKCKDRISGFEGLCTGFGEWLYSCIKVCITPQKLNKETGLPGESGWFDEPQVELVEEKIIEPGKKTTGGYGKSVSKNASDISSERRF